MDQGYPAFLSGWWDICQVTDPCWLIRLITGWPQELIIPQPWDKAILSCWFYHKDGCHVGPRLKRLHPLIFMLIFHSCLSHVCGGTSRCDNNSLEMASPWRRSLAATGPCLVAYFDYKGWPSYMEPRIVGNVFEYVICISWSNPIFTTPLLYNPLLYNPNVHNTLFTIPLLHEFPLIQPPGLSCRTWYNVRFNV